MHLLCGWPWPRGLITVVTGQTQWGQVWMAESDNGAKCRKEEDNI